MSLRFDDRAVIVTGAARGIGLAVARRFVRAGATVVMVDRDERRLEAEVETANGEGHDGRALAFVGDVSQKLTMTNLMAMTLDSAERLDVLVNAARLMVAADALADQGDLLEAILMQNVIATYRLSRLAAERMIAQAEGRAEGAIVNITSVYARRTPPRLLAYGTAGAALDQMTRTMALALAPRGIRVNGVAIGSMPGQSVGAVFPEIDDLPRSFARATPLGRAGRPQEAAEAALFLASSAAAFITGEIVTVDGGRSLRDAPLVEAASERSGS
jgi:7-alpha-hydroxysteroid dehydrogenase